MKIKYIWEAKDIKAGAFFTLPSGSKFMIAYHLANDEYQIIDTDFHVIQDFDDPIHVVRFINNLEGSPE